jgi:predicted glycosyltransferase/peptidoglycan/xylan/chitin deacetylase (PgdA/CDA1 family)
MSFNSLYYRLKPVIPRRLQIEIRRQIVLRKRAKYAHIWPIDERAGKPPEGWTGWPDGKKFALVLTHDVETAKGLKNCREIAEIEESLGFRSSFNFVAEDYEVPDELIHFLKSRGFEVGVHGLHHHGNLFGSRKKFNEQVPRIDRFIERWGAKGFRTPSLYHNLDWIAELDIEYDSSTFDTDPFEPQPDGVGTIFPFWVPGNNGKRGYVELPYTLPQDHSLFVIMGEKNIDIWKKKLDWIAEQGGMALLITHPDYINFGDGGSRKEEYPLEHYKRLLDYVRVKYLGYYWHALPGEMARYCEGGALSKKTQDIQKGARVPSKQGPRTLPSRQLSRKKIWIDLDNSPHVPFFHPIISQLESLGHEVFVTARDCSQTCGLADLFAMQYKRVGRHYGKNIIFKVTGTVYRATQLSRIARKHKPNIAISHGSRAQMLSALMLGVPTLVIMDYEHVKGFVHPTWILVPEIISDGAMKYGKDRILRYPGIKEDVYVPCFKPDLKIRHEFGIEEDTLLVTIRPPAIEAHYHNPQSETLFLAAVNYLGNKDNVRMVILPRYDEQRLTLTNQWPEWYRNGKILIPEHVVDGLNLIWASDFVISGGGTMNREAAALGVPVYSIFRGKIGAVDRYLNQKGRLTLLEDKADIPNKIKLVKRDRELKVDKGHRTLDVIVNHILKVLETR